jgi:hypothetical protein
MLIVTAVVLYYIARLMLYVIVLVLIFDSALFRSGVYERLLEPGSYAGQFAAVVKRARATQPPKAVLVLGDSRMNEGFSSRIAEQVSKDFRFISVAVPGSSLRTWFYILREADPTRHGFSVVILPVDDYDDEDGPVDRDDETTDIRIIAPALRLRDIPDFVSSYRQWGPRLEMLRAATLKGLIYNADLRAFLRSPAKRIEDCRAFAIHGAEWQDAYLGNPTSLDGLSMDGRILHLPSTISAPIRSQLEAVYSRPPSPQTGRYKQYRQNWIRRILALYRSGGTKFIVIKIPRNPLSAPHYARYDPDSAIRSLRSEASVIVIDENTFTFLERPTYFADALHLNTSGRNSFSSALGKLVGAEM